MLDPYNEAPALNIVIAIRGVNMHNWAYMQLRAPYLAEYHVGQSTTRRSFFRSAAGSAALLGIEGKAPASGQTGADFTRQSAALEADTVVDSACQFCNS